MESSLVESILSFYRSLDTMFVTQLKITRFVERLVNQGNKHNSRRYLDGSDIRVSTQGFEITSSNISKNLKKKRAKLMKKWKISTENRDLLQRY